MNYSENCLVKEMPRDLQANGHLCLFPVLLLRGSKTSKSLLESAVVV